ncbi:Phage lysozyme [compost metagenome]
MPSNEDLSAFSADAEPAGDRLPIQTLNISENGVKMIKTFESFAAKKYLDNTKYAIGYGHNLTDQEAATGIIQLSTGPVIINNGITMEQADELLRRDIKKIAENPIHNKVAVNLYQREYDVLCSMVYNLGPGGILGSDSTLLKVLNRGQYSQVPAQIIRWNKWSRGGQMVVNSGLDQRRKLEAQHWGTA